MAEKNNRPVSLDKMRQNSMRRRKTSRQSEPGQPASPAPQKKATQKKAVQPVQTIEPTQGPPRKPKRKKKGLIYQRPVQIAASLIVMAAVILIIPFHNAYKVVYGEETIAYIQKDKNYTEEAFNSAVNDYLKSIEGAPIIFSDTLKLVSARTGKDNITPLDTLMPMIKEKVPYHIQATRITVNNAEIAIVANQEIWNDIKEELFAPYQTAGEGAEIESIDFDEEYYVDTSAQVEPGAAMTKEEALEKLKQTREIDSTYTVVSGDTFDRIAPKVGMTRDQLQSANPEANSSDLKIGQTLNIKIQKPILSVRSVEKTSQQETLDKEIQYQDDPSMPQGTNAIEQAGTAAVEEVVTYTTKINGVVQPELTTTERNLVAAGIPEIVKRGTGQ